MAGNVNSSSVTSLTEHKLTHTWTIKQVNNFLDLAQCEDHETETRQCVLESTEFGVAHFKFKITIVPYFLVAFEGKVFSVISLHFIGPVANLKVRINSLGIITGNGSMFPSILNQTISVSVPDVIQTCNFDTHEQSFASLYSPGNELTIKLSMSLFAESKFGDPVALQPHKLCAERTCNSLGVKCIRIRRPIQCDLARDLGAMYDRQISADITLRVESRDILAHRVVLMSRSPVFRSLLANEVSVESVTGICEIKSLTFEAVSALVEFMYSDSIGIMPGDSLAIWTAAVRYNVPGLMHLCEQDLMQTTTNANICTLIEATDRFGSTPMRKFCVDFVRNNMEVITSDKWVYLELTHPYIAASVLRWVIREIYN